MMRISDLLNNNTAGDHSDEEEVAQIADASYDAVKLRRALSAHDYGRHRSHEGDDECSSGADDTGRLSETTHYASSLLDALSLQSMAKLNSKRSPTALNSSPSSATSPHAHYLTMENLTNPDDMGEMKQEHPSEDQPQHAAADQVQSKKRSTRSLFPAATDSDRRAKQRMIVKRCYYKKINTIKTLRDEVQSLEQQFHAAIQERQGQKPAIQDGIINNDQDGPNKLSDLYIQSLTVKESLRKENQRLRRLADEYYMKNQGRLRILLDSNKKVSITMHHVLQLQFSILTHAPCFVFQGITLFTPALDN